MGLSHFAAPSRCLRTIAASVRNGSTLKLFDYDLIIIGANVGSYSAALHAVEKGPKQAIVEGDVVGGMCISSRRRPKIRRKAENDALVPRGYDTRFHHLAETKAENWEVTREYHRTKQSSVAVKAPKLVELEGLMGYVKGGKNFKWF